MRAERRQELCGGAVGDAVACGRELLGRLGGQLVTTGSGLASTVLPAGRARIVVFGVPVPVFACGGGWGGDLHLVAMEWLGGLRRELPPGAEVVLQSFGPCVGGCTLDRCLAWFPGAAARWDGSSRPLLLGVDLVTVHPVAPDDAARWPAGPPALLRFAERLEAGLPALYRRLDGALTAAVTVPGRPDHAPWRLRA